MKKTIVVCTLLGVVLCQSASAMTPFLAVGELPEVASTMGLLGLAIAGVAAISWKRKK